jgi:hypothetical protein
VKHLFANNANLNDNLLSPRPRFLKRAPYTCEPLRCKTYDPEQVVALHRVRKRVSVWGGCSIWRIQPGANEKNGCKVLDSCDQDIETSGAIKGEGIE